MNAELLTKTAEVLGRRVFKLHTDKGLSVNSFLTDVEVYDLLKEADAADDFAASLRAAWIQYKSWTPNRRAWAHKKAIEILAVKVPVVASAPAAPQPARTATPSRTVQLENMSGIMALFLTARENGTAFPKIRFALSGGVKIMLSLTGSKSAKPGTINVTNGKKYGEADNVWFGRIDPETGNFQRGRDCPENVVSFLKEFASDPANKAAEYGRKTGYCCFCAKILTTKKGNSPRCRALYSVDVGYGPDCAKKYNLPYGMAAAVARASETTVEEENALESALESAEDRDGEDYGPSYGEAVAANDERLASRV